MIPIPVKVLVKLLLLTLEINCLSQNLIPNPGFEINTGYSDKNGNISLVKDWWSPFGNAYYFHSNNNYQTEYRWIVPKGQKLYNETPVQALNGKAYVGIGMSSVLHPKNQDYLMTKLMQPLIQNQRYVVSMWVRLADVWKYIDYIGVYLSQDKYVVSKAQLIERYIPYKKEYERELLPKRVSLMFKEDTLHLMNRTENLNCRDKWVKIEGEYLAKGGEEYITIGNFSIAWKGLFSNNVKPKEEVVAVDGLYLINGVFDYSHYDRTFYYIDDVSVAPIPIQKSRIYQAFSSGIKLGEAIELKNIYFDTGLANLKQDSYPTLNLLLTYMKENKQLFLLVEGHTDNVGVDETNKSLSENRAKAVVNFLAKNNISTERMKAIGYGNTRPVSDNLTPEGRTKNRRVEISLTTKQ